MTSNTTVAGDLTRHSESGGEKSARLHYLDWLQVLAILGVFLFHALHPFDFLQQQKKQPHTVYLKR